MIVKRGFKFNLKPTSAQENLFRQFAGACRWVFNRGLDQKQKAFNFTGKSPSYFEQNKELTLLKEQPDTSWLSEIHSQVLQQSLKDLDRSFQNFFRKIKKKETPDYPKFKKKGTASQLYRQNGPYLFILYNLLSKFLIAELNKSTKI